MIKQMRNIMIWIVCMLICLCSCSSGSRQAVVEPADPLTAPILDVDGTYTPQTPPEGMELVAQDGFVAMFADMSTGLFAVEDMRSGTLWYSNPVDREEDEVAAGAIRNWLHSQLLVNDVILSSRTVRSKNNYTASTKEGGVSVEKIPNGIKVTYRFVDEGYTIPVRYELCGDGFRASIQADEILEEGTERILSVSLLPMFGAQNGEKDGFMLIGNGSGAVIEFDNGKTTNAAPYRSPVYGQDESVVLEQKQNQQENSPLPVLGLQADKTGFLAICDQGAGQAYFNASVSGLQTQYSNAYYEFTLRSSQSVTIGDESSSDSRDVVTFDETPLQGNFGVRYFLQGEEEQGLAGMADVTRDYLQALGATGEMPDQAPLYLSVLGAIRRPSSILGIRTDVTEALTTIEQAGEIVDDLMAGDVQNIRMILDGWSNSKLDGKITTGLDLTGKLGKVKDLQSLAERLAAAGGSLSLKAELVRYNKGGNGISLNGDAVYGINNDPVEVPVYRRNTFFPNEDQPTGRLLSMGRAVQMMGSLADVLQKRSPATGLMLGSLSNTVYTDYQENGYRRGNASAAVVQALEELPSSLTVIGDGPNFYLLPEINEAVNIPSDATRWDLVDYAVPFYQMVLHGWMPYASRPINISGDPEDAFLYCIESGSALHYEVTYEAPENLKETMLETYYGADYSAWKDSILEQYRQAEALYEKTADAHMTGYEIIAPDVAKTTYENGVYTIVNRSDEDITVGEITVEAKSFYIGEAGEDEA